MSTRRLPLPDSIDLAQTLRWTSVRAATFGRVGSSHRGHRRTWQWAGRSPDGPVTLVIEALPGSELEIAAWGEGSQWGLETAPGLLGFEDDVSSFDPPPGLVAELHRRSPGLRLGKTGLVFQALLPAVLGQKVTGLEAKRSYRGIVETYGEPAPGPVEGWVAPAAETLADLSYADLHPHGVERKRAAVLIEAARRHKRLEEALNMQPAAAKARLTAIRGVGHWTAALVMGAAMGDPDAVPVGDYHVPNTVSWALAREPRGSDERMLELLEPYAGHRRRAITLIKGAGISAPKYGPKLAPRSITGH